MAKMIRRGLPALVVGLLVGQQADADKVAAVSVERMTYDSDVVFVGRAEKQDLIRDGFVLIDTDGSKKHLDVAITTFMIEKALKGPQATSADVCSIVNPLKFADIERGKTYILFLQRTGKHLQRTYGSMSQIEIESGRIVAQFVGTAKELDNTDAAVAAISKAAAIESKPKFRNRPYSPYENKLYKIVKNLCDDR